MKRFYSDVAVGDGLGILLDSRSVRTPARAELVLPNAALAEAIADEWRNQADRIDPASMPLCGLANAAIDRIGPEKAAFAENLARYGETDLLCYRAEEPFELVARQNQEWNPLLGWAQQRFGVDFVLVRGVMHAPQPEATLARLGTVLAGHSAFELAALSQLITISGSLVIGLALGEQAIAADTAFDIAHLDELWQAEQWGEDWMAADARAIRRRDFLAAARFLDLLRG